MAMSKKCFIYLMAIIVAIVAGAIIFVAIKMQNFTDEEKPETDPEETEIELTYNGLSPRKAMLLCEAIINGTEPSFGLYNDPAMFNGLLGVGTISTRVLDSYDGDTYQKSSYWLTGNSETDRATMSDIRVEACKSKIPVVVIAMRPNTGMKLSGNGRLWSHYKPKSFLETWDDYDKKLNTYLKYLAPIPSIVILEPDLLMSSFEKAHAQYTWLNEKYKEQFYHRAQRVIKVLSRSWVYIDAGNAAYLTARSNMETMAKSLLRLDGLRGFAINTGHYFNTSFTNVMARRLHCRTGLHYITDTSRNGGPFSRQSVREIAKCFFDPPRMLAGLPPGWSWGTKSSPRQKRWSPDFNPPSHSPQPSQQPSYFIVRNSQPPIRQATNRQAPNQQQNPEQYNQWINQMGNGGGSHGSPQQGSIPQSQPQNPNHHQPSNGNSRSYYNDLAAPTGKVPISVITAPSRTQPTRNVKLRAVQEALGIFRRKTTQRFRCLRKEAVSVHDGNVWIMTPGESDGRLFEYGTHHKCLIGHTKQCDERCRLAISPGQRPASCGCDRSNAPLIPLPRQPTQPSNNFNGGLFSQNPESQNSQETASDGNPFQGNSQILYASDPAEPRSGPVQSGPPSLEDILRQGS